MTGDPSPGGRRPGGQRGAVAAELAVAFPLLLLLLLGIFQFALWHFASQVALGAAQEGARAARAYGTGAGAGLSTARAVLAAQAGGWLLGPQVRVAYDTGDPATADTVIVEVTGQVVRLVPLDLQVRQAVGGPVERFRNAGEG